MRNHITGAKDITIVHRHFHAARLQQYLEYGKIINTLQLCVKGFPVQVLHILQWREFVAYDSALLDRCHKGFPGEVMPKHPSYRLPLATSALSRVIRKERTANIYVAGHTIAIFFIAVVYLQPPCSFRVPNTLQPFFADLAQHDLRTSLLLHRQRYVDESTYSHGGPSRLPLIGHPCGLTESGKVACSMTIVEPT